MRKIPQLILCTARRQHPSAVRPTQRRGNRPIRPPAGSTAKNEYRPRKSASIPATGTARFVRLAAPASVVQLGTASAAELTREAPASLRAAAASFVDRHASAFGLARGSADLELRKAETDAKGQTHLTVRTAQSGLPVFGATLKAHFDAAGR